MYKKLYIESYSLSLRNSDLNDGSYYILSFTRRGNSLFHVQPNHTSEPRAAADNLQQILHEGRDRHIPRTLRRPYHIKTANTTSAVFSQNHFWKIYTAAKEGVPTIFF